MIEMLKTKISDKESLKAMSDFSAVEYIKASSTLKRFDPVFSELALDLFERDTQNAPKTLSTLYSITATMEDPEKRIESENKVIDLIEKCNYGKSQNYQNRDYHMVKNLLNASMF
jgi:hypothetical protein